MLKRILAAAVTTICLFANTAHCGEVRSYVEQTSLWRVPTIIVDGKRHDTSFFTGYNDLEDAMQSNPDASAFAHTARTQMIWGNSLLLAGTVGAIAYSFANTSNHDDGAFWGIFFVGYIPGIFLEAAGRVNINRAVNAYNGVGKGSEAMVPHLNLAPTVGGGEALLSWNF